jgi:hypothetical protein
VTETLEWWADYGGGPLWKASGRGGQQVDSERWAFRWILLHG